MKKVTLEKSDPIYCDDAIAAALLEIYIHAERIGVNLLRFDDLMEVVRRAWIEEATKKFGISKNQLDAQGTGILATKYREEFRRTMERIVANHPKDWKKKGRAKKVSYLLLFSVIVLLFATLLIAGMHWVIHRVIPEELIKLLNVPF